METCTNCGQALRPGAKFCTTCGTRLNETSTTPGGWGNQSVAESQQTTVLEAVEPPAERNDTSKISEQRHRTADAWTSAYESASTPTNSSAASDDPASRFISALDEDVKPVVEDTEEAASDSDPASTWETPALVFTPPPPSNWSYSGSEESESTTTEVDSTWETPATWAAVTSTPEAPADASEDDEADDDDVDSAGFSDDGNDEVDYLSGDENIARSGDISRKLPPDEARDKAIALADELRRTIRMMSSEGESDYGAAAMALTEVSLHIGDFSDVRGLVAEVKESPRDIRTLGGLAGKIDRIQALLDEHASLANAIETAIKELDGQ